MKRLAGKVALVTGAGRKNGIGAVCARRLASEGAAVVVTDISGNFAEFPDYKVGAGEELAAVANAIKKLGVEALPLFADVSSEESVSTLVQKAQENMGRIDILVNNAGGSPGPAPLTQFTLAAWEKTLAINLTGTFLCCREVVPLMIEQGGGKIINISSRAAQRGAIWMHAYSAAKAGILGLTRSMAVELAAFNICVNALCPGDIETDFKQWGLEVEARIKDKTVAELKEEIAGATPLGRLGRPEDVAAAVAFFASADSDYLTGEVLNITGGHGLGNATARPSF
ncbi:MAG TPA: SDR family oxidoreductase [Firmicutes bacterium]|nr:SDR family oxidoreductase [Bacillota bacterium]